MSYLLTIINENWIFPNANLSYVKSSQMIDLVVDFPIEAKNYKKSNPNDDIYVQFSYTSEQNQVIEFVDIFNFTGNFSIDKLYSYGSILKLKFKDVHTKTLGNLNFNLSILVKKKNSDGSFTNIDSQPYNIPGVLQVQDTAGTVINNLALVNFANDNLNITGLSSIGYVLQINSTISYQGKTKQITIEELFINGKSIASLQGVFQPYIYLSETQIEEFFTTFKLNIEPAIVTINTVILNNQFEVLQQDNLGTFKFFAGKEKNLYKQNQIIERSMNYNTFLPLAFEYEGQDVKITFNGTEKIINKQLLSTSGKILQLLFSQRSNAFQENKYPSFSSGFSLGFATSLALENAESFHLYKEAQVNEIESYYKVIGYNFPWQKQAFNIFWIDENNIFRSLPVTGTVNGEKQIKNYLNENAVNINHYKAGNTVKDVRKVNTGFILESETDLVLNLQNSKQAWFFGDNPSERIFCVAVSSKIAHVDTDRELIQYDLDLEFYE